MSFEASTKASAEEEVAALRRRVAELEQKNDRLELRVAWFERYFLGARSERRTGELIDPKQLSLGEWLESTEPPPETETIRSYERRTRPDRVEGELDAGGLRFGPNVPVETVVVEDEQIAGLEEGKDFEVVAEKVTHRLAQRPAAYVVLRYVRKVIKLKVSAELHTAPAPCAVFERSYADVSFLAGLLIEKFVYHLPLYRQHQRLQAAGIELSRQTLTNLVSRAIELLEPIYHAQLSSILQSKVLAMDETPVKAGRTSPGKMKTAYFWPIFGDKNEVAYPFSTTRAHGVVREVLGKFAGTLVTDGYEAYQRFASSNEQVTHALCWSHARRKFIEAESSHPKEVSTALELIRELYAVEDKLRVDSPEKIIEGRSTCSREIVDRFFSWVQEQLHSRLLLNSDPLTKALAYSMERERGLRVFLSDPYVPMDTNHLERAIRPIPLGRKNWLFCWTELGADVVGRAQSLLSTCRLHGVDPYTYLVDVLQRIDRHPARDVHLLTPRLWKENFADAPLVSDLFRNHKHVA